MPEAPSTPPLHLPHGINYACIKCGRSCGEFWEIPVDPAMSASIRAREMKPLAEAGARDPHDPVIASPWTPGGEMMRLHDSACCLQGQNGLCTLHSVYGFDSKPNICRSFPYRFVQTPGGTFAGLTFACTAVLGNLGPAVEDQRADLEHLATYTYSRPTIASPIALTTDLPLAWEQYVQIEEDLAALMQPAVGGIGTRLGAQAVYLQLLVKFLRQERQQFGAEAAGPELNSKALGIFRARMRASANHLAPQTAPSPLWALPLALARKGRPSPLLRRMILGFAHTMRNTYGRRRGRLTSYLLVVREYLRHSLSRGVIALPILPRPVRYAELRAVRFNPDRPELNELLTRYFTHALIRKDLLIADSVHLGHQMQLLHWGLIHWYAAALAAASGAPEIALEHLTEALRNVEKYYVFHSTFHRLFSRYPLLRSFMDYLFAHPLYIFSLSHGEWE